MSAFELVELVMTADDVPLPDEVSEDRIASLVQHILTAEEASGAWSLGIRFVDDPEMQRMHRDFMDLDSPTDIMTFPHEEPGWPGADSDDASQGGDLVISVDRAADHARDAGWDHAQELWFLIVHGILHLLGWDDHDDTDRAAMLARQRDLVDAWARQS